MAITPAEAIVRYTTPSGGLLCLPILVRLRSVEPPPDGRELRKRAPVALDQRIDRRRALGLIRLVLKDAADGHRDGLAQRGGFGVVGLGPGLVVCRASQSSALPVDPHKVAPCFVRRPRVPDGLRDIRKTIHKRLGWRQRRCCRSGRRRARIVIAQFHSVGR